MINREISNKILTVGCEYHPPPPMEICAWKYENLYEK